MSRSGILLTVLLLPVALALVPSSSTAATKAPALPVIFDTDIGDDIDDTWALVMLLKSPELDVKLVTTTYGKAEYRAKLLAKLLTVAKRTDISIGLGVGGRTGTGGQEPWVKDYHLSDYPGKIHEDGVAAMIDLVEHSRQPISIISVGPCDTVAAALDRHPDIAGKASFVGMDGSVRKGYDGNKNPSAEWNVKANVPAARKVLSAPWRQITITPLDTCGLVRIAGKRFQTLAKSDEPLVKALLENYRIWAKKDQVRQLSGSSVLFDTVAIYLAYPQKPLVQLETLPIVVTDDGFTRIDPAGRKMVVATDWTSLDGYDDLLVEILTRK